MTEDSIAAVRAYIGKTLAHEPEGRPRSAPETDREFARIRSALRALPRGDIEGKIALSGLKNHAGCADQRGCRECIYFQAQYHWCDMPELRLPVEPSWHCLFCCT
jgi:hypothetical protein